MFSVVIFSVTLIICLLNITLIAGIIPLIERKYLSLIQRRVGPNFIGYKGRLQFIADALKLFFKDLNQPANMNKNISIFLPSLVLSISYLFWINTLWSKNLLFIYVEYNILVFGIFSLILEMLIILTGSINKNKYSFISSIRSAVIMFAVELLLMIFLLFVFIYMNSLFLFPCFIMKEEWYPLFNYIFCLHLFLIITLIETCRAPFDLNEAESELITGFHIEYSSFLFGLYYLAEYFNLFFFSAFLVILFVDDIYFFMTIVW